MVPSARKSKDSHINKEFILFPVHLMFERFFGSVHLVYGMGKIFCKYLTDSIFLPLNSLFSYKLPPPEAWVSVTGPFQEKSLQTWMKGLRSSQEQKG